MQLYTRERAIVTASADGDVRVWDPRFSQSVRTLSSMGGNTSVCEIHPRAPLMASANQNQGIRIANLESDEVLSHIRYHDGFMGQKLGPTRCLAFHPYRVRTPPPSLALCDITILLTVCRCGWLLGVAMVSSLSTLLTERSD